MEPNDADPGLPNEQLLPIYADHITICKPEKRTDDVYVHVRAFIKRGLPAGQAEGAALPVDEAILKQARKCLGLLTEIQAANARIIQRGQSGGAQWARMLKDTYNCVCQRCHQRRLGTEPPDAYLDVICAEPDIDIVCKNKWELGEALDDYRNLLSAALSNHRDLELLIRRSITQPDWSPEELQRVVRDAIVAAGHILA